MLLFRDIPISSATYTVSPRHRGAGFNPCIALSSNPTSLEPLQRLALALSEHVLLLLALLSQHHPARHQFNALYGTYTPSNHLCLQQLCLMHTRLALTLVEHCTTFMS